ncbi:MAG: hypothetical protein ABIK12_12400 [Pseudomonadota bacterium]
MVDVKADIGVFNEWGRLREAMVGIEDHTVEPEYIEEFAWMSPEGQALCKKFGGQPSEKAVPERVALLREQVERHVKVLEDFGVKVYRNQPLEHPEEIHYLDEVQKGRLYTGGADFFRVIGNDVILLNNLRYPFRRKQVFTVRPVLEKLMEGRKFGRYVSLPPVSPHCTPDDMYLENGDIMADGHNVFVGMSGLATSPKGVAWLQRFLGPEYKIYTMKLAPNILHLDTALTLNRPGLLTYYPDFIDELPEPLKSWDKVVVRSQPGEGESFGANHLSLDEKHIVVAKEYERVGEELSKKGMEPILIPLSESMAYGSGSRCLTGAIRRDP